MSAIERPTREQAGDAPPADFASLRRFPRGAYLAMAGLPASHLYLIRRGVVRILVPDREPGREATTALLGPGQVVGIAGLLGGPTYHASVLAESAVEAWALPVARVAAALPDDRRLALTLLTALGERLGLTRAVLADSVLLPVSARIPDVVARLGSCADGDGAPLTRKLLATLIGARRETVSRIANGRRAP
jgi:CRP-like cAMP-binding protein